MSLRSVAVIPARMASSRFPGKPMKTILGMPMIGHCYHRVKMCAELEATYVATCDQEIFDYVENIGGNAVISGENREGCSGFFGLFMAQHRGSLDGQFLKTAQRSDRLGLVVEYALQVCLRHAVRLAQGLCDTTSLFRNWARTPS